MDLSPETQPARDQSLAFPGNSAATNSYPVHLVEAREEAERSSSPGWTAIYLLTVSLLLLLVLLRDVTVHQGNGDQYLYLANHLAQGDLTVDDLPDQYPDYANWQGHRYLPFGPLPGVALIPFLGLFRIGQDHDFAWVGHLYSLLNVVLFALVLGRAGIVGERRRWALLLYFGGTFYFAQAFVDNSWYFTHVLTTTCLLVAMFAVLGKDGKRPGLLGWLVCGLFVGLAGMTRFTTLCTLPFFAWLLWKGWNEPAVPAPDPSRRQQTIWGRVRAVFPGALMLAAGLAVPVALLAYYDFARFGSVLESGYSLSVQNGLAPSLDQARRDFGLFSPVFVPKNIFLMLLQGPLSVPGNEASALAPPYIQPSSWGFGIFFASPALLYAFRARIKEPLVQACWLAISFTVVPILAHFAPGWVQFGYRYAIDFLPFLLLLAARALTDPMTRTARFLILASVLINVWGAFFLQHWQFDVPTG